MGSEKEVNLFGWRVPANAQQPLMQELLQEIANEKKMDLSHVQSIFDRKLIAQSNVRPHFGDYLLTQRYHEQKFLRVGLIEE